VNRTRSLRRSRHLFRSGRGRTRPGYFNIILGDNGAAASRSLGEGLDAANNVAAVRAVRLAPT
jgi:hypothetical protein